MLDFHDIEKHQQKIIIKTFSNFGGYGNRVVLRLIGSLAKKSQEQKQSKS
jgi:hypothetical protein